MIFSLHFSLIMAGYSACGILLGSYMIRYAGATELDLGFIFMIPPLTVFTRPFICARADRYQSHKQLLTLCCCVNFLAYIPFIVLPFLLEYPHLEEMLTIRLRFWILVLCHVFGSLAFCGIRSLGDALAVNYAKRVGSDFTSFRKFGAISFGVCGFCLGLINQNWILPDFVPSFIMNVVAIFLLMILFYLWPDEYFVMCSNKPPAKQLAAQIPSIRIGPTEKQQQTSVHEAQNQANRLIDSTELCQLANYRRAQTELPVGRELARRIMQKLVQTLFFCCPSKVANLDPNSKSILKQKINNNNANYDDNNNNNDNNQIIPNNNNSDHNKSFNLQVAPKSSVPNQLSVDNKQLGHQQPKPLTMSQQMQIFWLLIKRDNRIPLFLLLLLYGGLVGYAPQNFAFTYMNEFCHQKKTCDAASLSGLVMISYCVCETSCYLIINALKSRWNLSYVWLLELTLISLAIHYFSYGFLLPYYLSPYIFLVESLHGLEYSASLASGVELAYRFANEVDLLIPELIERGIISHNDNKELVRLSLMATMNGCFTFVYDGFGTIIGSFIYGLSTDTYSFTFTWRLIGTLASAGSLLVFFVVLLGKYLDIKPQIYKLRQLEDDKTVARSPSDLRRRSHCHQIMDQKTVASEHDHQSV